MPRPGKPDWGADVKCTHHCVFLVKGEQAGVKGGLRPAKRTLEARLFADTLSSGGQEAHPEPVRRRGLPRPGGGERGGVVTFCAPLHLTRNPCPPLQR